MKGNILIVDDEESIREILSAALKPVANCIFTAASADEGIGITLEENLDVVVCDIRMPGMNGLDFLKKVKEEQPEIKFLMITAHGSMETVMEAMRYNASDFMTKPFDNKKVRETVQKLLTEKNQRREPINEVNTSGQFEGIIGESDTFKKCIRTAIKAAGSESNILLLGESGTGKEVIARAVHQASSRKDGPFIPINCGAIPDNLLESELFGYEKGAFTGALDSKPGKFFLGDQGTIFLDEIGDMPGPMQVKLLRVLQEKIIEPVGGIKGIEVDFRLISATNKDLEHDVGEGKFREDLFYRLNIIPVKLPPLRERGNDIIMLADFFLEKFNRRYSTGYNLTSRHKQQLLDYYWPGNIRELESVLERGVVLGEGELEMSVSKSSKFQQNSEKPNLKSRKREHEKDEIISALEKNRWNKTKTAQDLGISRRSLLYKVKEYSI